MSNSLPLEFIERLKLLYPNTFDAVYESFSTRKPTTFRVNLLKTTKIELEETLHAEGFEIEETDIKDAFVLKNRSQRELTEISAYKEGLFYIQGLSSMIPPFILNPVPTDCILDACAAPGSKTTQIAAMMKNEGQIIANDMSKVRLYKLAANLKTLGVTNVQTTHFRAQELWKKFPNTFDKVLVDVPCSLEGRFYIDNPKTYTNWSVKKLKVIAEHQKHILRSAISAAKIGGTIVYSTCTLAPEENEEVISWILKKCPEVRLVEIVMPQLNTQPGIAEWQGQIYDPEIAKTVRIMPNNTMEAFYVAKLVKE